MLRASGVGVFVFIALTGVAQARTFGIEGSMGSSGYPGTPGQDYNANTTVVVPAGQMIPPVIVRGTDGGPGGTGQDGEYARNCYMDSYRGEDQYGARGGDGGYAGAGGRGGNGGNVTLRYMDPADLKNVLVDASGGRGGLTAALPGRGGRGCACSVYSWNYDYQVCEHHPNQHDTCHMVHERHYCHEGANGRDGSYQDGGNGSTGGITLIRSDKPDGADRPEVAVPVGMLPYRDTLTLDHWSTLAGAAGVLAPGSRVADTYTLWAGRSVNPVSVLWNARRPTSDIQSLALQLSIRSGHVEAATDPAQLWTRTSVATDATGSRISVDVAVLPSEVLRLSGRISGVGLDTIVTLDDAAGVSDLLQSYVWARVVNQATLDHERFKGNVPAELVEASARGLVIRVGRLPSIDPSGDTFKKGSRLKLELFVTRKLDTEIQTQKNDPAIVLKATL